MKHLLFLFASLFLSFTANSQIITSVVGGGTSGVVDGVPATASVIICPEDICFDKFGNLYITEALSHRIRKVNTSGIISTIAGTGSAGFTGDGLQATSAMLNQPSGITSDTSGNIFFCDQANNRIRRIDAITGVITTVAGTGVSGYNGDGMLATTAQLNYPYGVYYDKQTGGIYISDNANHRVRFVNTLGIISTIAGNGLTVGVHDGGPATNAACCPTNVCKDGVGNLYISDGCFRTVRKMNTVGIISTIAGDTSGYIYNGDGILATTAKIAPGYICLDDSGLVCIPDNYNHRVRKVDASGIIHTIAGNGINAYNGDNGPATIASINQPNAVRFDKCGNLYIAQINTPRIRKVTYPQTPYISISGTTAAAIGSTVTLTASVANAGYSYTIQWYNKGILFSTTSAPTVSYTKTMVSDSITAKIFGCSDSSLSQQLVVWDTHVGVGNLSQHSMLLYPLPVQDVLHLNGVLQQADYIVSDITGRQVMTGTLLTGDNELHIEGLTNGVYVLEVRCSNGERGVYKVVKE